MKVGIIGSHLRNLSLETALDYETAQIKQFLLRHNHTSFLIDPLKTTYGIIDNQSFAEFRDRYNNTVDVKELDALLIRRTRSAIDEVMDFADFAARANPRLAILDPLSSFGRPTSKIESIVRRAGIINQPNTQIFVTDLPLKLDIQFPVIAKPSHGAGGRGVESIQDIEELRRKIEKTDPKHPFSGHALLVQEQLDIEREYRVMVVGGKAIGCAEKPKLLGDARNAARGNDFKNYDGKNRSEVLKFAERVSLFLEQDISGVDIIESKGDLYLIECNRNPQFEAFDFATGIRTADFIVKLIEKKVDVAKRVEVVEKSVLKSKTSIRPRIFVGSSSEGIDIANAIQFHLDKVAQVVVWNQGTFEPSVTGFDNLVRLVEDYDYAIFCVTPDDRVSFRETSIFQPRDNIIFEAGLFMGVLGSDRVILVVSEHDKLKLPSDIAGLTLVDWRPHDGDDIRPALGKPATEIKIKWGLK